MDVGLELRQARERRGLTLQQISHTTKISLRVLQAIEASDEARLPAPVFTRSFVRSYAGEVGLEPDETVRRYLEHFVPPADAEAQESSDHDADSPRTIPLATWRGAAAAILRGRFTTPAILAAVVVSLIGLSIRNYSRVQPNATQPPAPVTAAPVGTAGSTGTASPPPAAAATAGTTPAVPDQLHLTIVPSGKCWVQARVKGQSVLAELLKAGDRRELDTPSDVTLRVGEPGTFAFTINGLPARLAAAAGHPVTVHVTKENYRTFLSK